jgi:hypothetical protein
MGMASKVDGHDGAGMQCVCAVQVASVGSSSACRKCICSLHSAQCAEATSNLLTSGPSGPDIVPVLASATRRLHVYPVTLSWCCNCVDHC